MHGYVLVGGRNTGTSLISQLLLWQPFYILSTVSSHADRPQCAQMCLLAGLGEKINNR